MTASGTAGRGNELGCYGRLDRLGDVVVKSLNAAGWDGNPYPRLAPLPGGMLNSVGLQGPPVRVWLQEYLPGLVESGACVVASIWGRTPEEYHAAAEALRSAPSRVVAVEVNLSCPNLGSSNDTARARESVEASAVCGRPICAKLSPASQDLGGVAASARQGGAEAVVLVNTMPGMAIDVNSRRSVLSGPGGGVSGPLLRPVAVRAVYEVFSAVPGLPIVGVGGVSTGTDALELILAGASAVQVGTAIFDDPRAPWRVQNEIRRWCRSAGVSDLSELTGAAHQSG